MAISKLSEMQIILLEKLTTNDAEFNEVSNIIFEQFPGVTAVNGTGENYTTRSESEAEKVMREKKG